MAKKRDRSRNWRIIGLTPDNRVQFEVVELRGAPAAIGGGALPLGVYDSGLTPTEWGLDDRRYSRAERAILRRGVTSTGRDRLHPKEAR